MAPAAFSTISTFFTDTGMTPSDFDYIVTGDLGKVGSRILCELFERENINIRDNHKDCGMMLYDLTSRISTQGEAAVAVQEAFCAAIFSRSSVQVK